MAVDLPRAYAGSAGRRGRGGVALPGPENVPQVRTQSVAAPRVPDTASRDSTDGLMRAAYTWASGVNEAAERQQKLYDATQTTEAQLAFEKSGMTEFQRIQTQDDPSRPDFITTYDGYLKKQQEEVLKSLSDGVRPEAREMLRLKMSASAQGMVDSAGRLSLTASQNKAKASIDGLVNKYSAQAARDPDFLDTLLTNSADDIGAFRDTMTPDAERAAFQKSRESIIRSAVSGYVNADRYADAEKLIGSGKFDADLDPSAVTAINADIKRGKAAARAEIRDLATDHFASLSMTGVGISGLDARAAKILDGADLADFRSRQATASKVYTLSQDFKFASVAQIEKGLSALQPKPGSTRFAEEQRSYDQLVSRASRMLKARHDDPAGYAMQDPKVADAFKRAESEPDWLPIAVTRSLALQEQMGVPSTQRKVMPAGSAKEQVAQLGQMDPERAADTMLSLQTQYGKFWPKAFGELVAEKLPPEMQILGTLDTPADSIVRKDLAQALKAGRKTLGDNIPSELKTEADKAIQGALDPWSRLELSRGATETNVQSMRSAAELLTYSKVSRGMSPSDAASEAVKSLVTSRYDILDSSGYAMYVPKGLGAEVESAADGVLSGLKAEDMADIGGAPSLTPEQRKGEYLKAAKRGKWVLNETGDGTVLLDSLGQPVMARKGEGFGRVEFRFSDIPNMPKRSVPDIQVPMP
jgi:hypothetical protein